MDRMFPFSHQSLFHTRGALLLSLTVLASILFLRSNHARAANVSSDALLRSTQEERVGGPIPTNPDSRQIPWEGTRFPVNPFWGLIAPVYRALESVAGIDAGGPNRSSVIDSVFEKWKDAGVKEEEIDLLKYLSASYFFIDSSTIELPPESQENNRKVGSTPYDEDKFTFENFLRFMAPPSKNPTGREAIARAELFSVQEYVANARREALDSATFPKFLDEDRRAGTQQGTTPRPSPDPTLSFLTQPASYTAAVFSNLIGSPWVAAVSRPYPDVPISATSPDEKLPSVLAGSTQQAKVQSAAYPDRDASGSGRGNELVNTSIHNPITYGEGLVNQPVLDNLAQLTSQQIQQQLNTFSNTNQFFGPTTGTLPQLFGQDNFQNSIGSLFGGAPGSGPGGGGPSTLGGIPTNHVPPVESCAQRTPTLTADEAKAAAVLLGLPVSTSTDQPWNVTYAPARTLYGVQGTRTDTGQSTSIDESLLPDGESCVWVVSTTPPNDATHAAILSDVRSQAGVKVPLRINQQ